MDTNSANSARFRWHHKGGTPFTTKEAEGSFLGHTVAYHVYADRKAIGAVGNNHVRVWLDGELIHDHRGLGGLQDGVEVALNVLRERASALA